MERVRLRAFAKVNYALEVQGLRDDGYHEIRTVMQSVSLADEVEIERAQEGFALRVEPEGTDTGPLEENTVRKAWVALREISGEELAVRIRLHKRIPSRAGLGGGRIPHELRGEDRRKESDAGVERLIHCRAFHDGDFSSWKA